MQNSSESVGDGLFQTRGGCSRITVMKFGVNHRCGNGTGCCGIEVRADTANLANVIIAGFRKRLNLIRKGDLFIKHEAKVASRVGGV